MAKSRFDQRDKRRFIEAASMALMTAGVISNHPFKTVRQAVNVAGELWDELEVQYPLMEEE